MQSVDSYKTITAISEGLYKEKGSKFISYAYPVTSPEQVADIVKGLKKEYYDARHHCYAYRIGFAGEQSRAVDDGEPSSTAGKPILGQLLSYDVTNVLVVVIRYFGGTKLGVSGLIKAYKDATISALDSGEIVEKSVEKGVRLTFGYETTNGVMKVIKVFSPKIVAQRFDNLSVMELSVENRVYNQFIAQISDVEGVQVEQL